MPIYEFTCRDCDEFFEALVSRPGAKAPCPECGGRRVTKAISRPGGFAVKGAGVGEGACPATGGPMPPDCDAGGGG